MRVVKNLITTLALTFIIVACAVSAFAKDAISPSFSDSGPNADQYGKLDGYPIGNRFTFTQQRYLVGAFSHFDQFFPSRTAHHSAQPFVYKPSNDGSALTYEFEGATRTIQDYLNRNPVTGLLIAKDDRILFESYQYGRNDRDRFVSRSMGKTVTAMLVGIAVDEGAIRSVDDPVEVYLHRLKGTEYGKASIRNLLNMASGMKCSENYGGKDNDETFEEALLYGDPNATNDPFDILKQFDTRESEPGTKWNYAAPDPYILGLVLRGVTGKPVTQYLEEKIWQRIGTENNATWILDVSGQETGHGLISASLRDWARLGRLLANDGNWEGQVIPKKWIFDATTVHEEFFAPGKLYRDHPEFDLGYGYLTWIILPGPERRMLAMMGTRGQIVVIDPKTKLVMVQTAVRKNFVEPWTEVFALWRGVLRAFGQN
jgi:CubicO group peptidase (beta-lactamase class C family)